MNTWTLIDTETDGFYAPIHVIDIAAQKFDGLTPIGEPFQVFINHGIEIPPDATCVHGYTTEFVRKNGVDPSVAYQQLREFVEDDPIVAHYLRFDWDRVLVPELIRLRERPIGSRGFCSWMLSRRALPEHPTHKLDYLRDTYELECSSPHSALGDVESVRDLLTRVVFPRLASIGYDDLNGIREFSSISPVRKCKCLIEGLDYEEESRRISQTRKLASLREREAREQRQQFDRFILDIELGSYSVPSLLLDFDLIDENPAIEFRGKHFLFTGKMVWGTRMEAAIRIEERGGFVSKSQTVTNEIDYFVLGEDKDRGWTSLIHGGKITRAFIKRFKEPDCIFKIIREEDLIAALQSDFE
jgi:DNA polymerase III epsilon subunit-like protein